MLQQVLIWDLFLTKKNSMEQILLIGAIELFSSMRERVYSWDSLSWWASGDTSDADRSAYEKQMNEYLDLSSIILTTLYSSLQKKYELAKTHIMIVGFHGMFMNQARKGWETWDLQVPIFMQDNWRKYS
jgi:hypothetical protein